MYRLLWACKPQSAKIYHRMWKAYFKWCEERDSHPLTCSTLRTLDFLQSSLDQGSSLSSLKGQISALSVLFQRTLSFRPQVKTFLQGVGCCAPPFRCPLEHWDHNLVLQALQVFPFEPLHDISIQLLSWKVAFLIAITSIHRVSKLAALSCRSPFLVLHKDKVVLSPVLSCLPKVVSAFHISDDIVLPSFCPSPSHPLECSLHCLNVVRAVCIYLSITQLFRWSDSVFVIPEGQGKGLAASTATIARWIRAAVVETYRSKGRPPPFRLTAHSTRVVGASSAVRHHFSAS